jgi:hypothetical protein
MLFAKVSRLRRHEARLLEPRDLQLGDYHALRDVVVVGLVGAGTRRPRIVATHHDVVGVFPLLLLSEGDYGSLGPFLNGGVFVGAGAYV